MRQECCSSRKTSKTFAGRPLGCYRMSPCDATWAIGLGRQCALTRIGKRSWAAMKESTKLPAATFSSESEKHLIFVLAGLEARKSYGLQLLSERAASIILLSVARFDIRKFPNLNVPFA